MISLIKITKLPKPWWFDCSKFPLIVSPFRAECAESLWNFHLYTKFRWPITKYLSLEHSHQMRRLSRQDFLHFSGRVTSNKTSSSTSIHCSFLLPMIIQLSWKGGGGQILEAGFSGGILVWRSMRPPSATRARQTRSTPNVESEGRAITVMSELVNLNKRSPTLSTEGAMPRKWCFLSCGDTDVKNVSSLSLAFSLSLADSEFVFDPGPNLDWEMRAWSALQRC